MSGVPQQSLSVATLYSDHHGWLKNWLGRRLGDAMDAEDLTQDTFIRVIRSSQDPGLLREPRRFLVLSLIHI